MIRVGGCPVVVAQWQSVGCTSQVFWVRFPATAGLSLSSIFVFIIPYNEPHCTIIYTPEIQSFNPQIADAGTHS